MLEIWKPIEEFPNYEISNLGRVRSSISNRELKYSLNNRGIPTVGLLDDNRVQRRRSVSVLVANTFVERFPDRDYAVFDTPTHLDGDRQNCRADNIVMRPRWFAVMFHKERNRPDVFRGWWAPTKAIYVVETDETFPSPEDIAETYGVLAADVIDIGLCEQRPVFPHFYHYEMIH